MTNNVLNSAIAAVIFSLALLASPLVWAQDSAGQEEFRLSCAACHGLDGKGEGAIKEWLKAPPPDLTMLAKRNGGEFPYNRVFQMIDGRSPGSGHGSREMPVWGNRFSGQYMGEGGPLGSEMYVRGRILSVVYYLESIQTQ